MELELINDNLRQLITLRLAELRKGKAKPGQALELARMFRRLGCGELLGRKDADTFFLCLHRAADLYLQLLELPGSKRDSDPYYLARGRAEPLVDALALGDVKLALRIDARADTELHEGMEYEEDFWFLTLLPQLASPEALAPELQGQLEQLEQSLRGVAYPRYDVLRAIAEGDSKGFERGLKALTEAWTAELRRSNSDELGNPYALATEAKVFVEGVALVRVARARGLRTREKYRLIPPAALAEPRVALRRVPVWKARPKSKRARR
jgi:hypothetical protein